MKKWMFLFVLTILFGFPAFSSAEEEKKDKKIVSTMDEVVVTATKTEEKRKDIPNSLILMDEMDIEESPATGLGELLSNELGIDWRTRGNYGGAAQEIQIRGMSANGTQVLVNGVSVNSPSLGVADVGRIPLNNIERIEVVKGPGSLLYGSGAMGGTVNIITKRPHREKMDLKVSAGYGSENTYELSAEQGMFVLKDLGYYLTANRRETDGFRDNGDLDHKDVSLKVVFDKGDLLDVSLYADYIDRDYGVPGVKPPKGTRDYYVNGVKFYNDEAASLVDHGADEDYHFVLQVKGKPVTWLDYDFRADHMSMESYNFDRNPAGFFPALPGEGTETWVTNDVSGTELTLDFKPLKGASILVGGEYRDYKYENKQRNLDRFGVPLPATKVTRDHDVLTKGAYSEAQYRPCKFVKFLAGFRHENHSRFGHENLPRYGVVINPWENGVLKFGHGKHFKAPTMNDLYWPEDDWVRGNPNLKPETGRHTDATLEQDFLDGKLFFTLSYFDWDIKDKINWAENKKYPTLFGLFKWTPSNVDTYKAHGWEVGTKIGPYYNMSLDLSYTYTDAVEELAGGSERQSRYTPDHYFKGKLTYWSEIGLTATTTVRYMSDRPAVYANITDTKPGYTLDSNWVVDVALEQRLWSHWIFALQANNLFDEEYETYANNFTDIPTGTTTREGFPAAGLSVFFTATFEY